METFRGQGKKKERKEKKKKKALWENKELECSITPSSIWPIVKRSTEHNYSVCLHVVNPNSRKRKKKSYVPCNTFMLLYW